MVLEEYIKLNEEVKCAILDLESLETKLKEYQDEYYLLPDKFEQNKTDTLRDRSNILSTTIQTKIYDATLPLKIKKRELEQEKSKLFKTDWEKLKKEKEKFYSDYTELAANALLSIDKQPQWILDLMGINDSKYVFKADTDIDTIYDDVYQGIKSIKKIKFEDNVSKSVHKLTTGLVKVSMFSNIIDAKEKNMYMIVYFLFLIVLTILAPIVYILLQMYLVLKIVFNRTKSVDILADKISKISKYKNLCAILRRIVKRKVKDEVANKQVELDLSDRQADKKLQEEIRLLEMEIQSVENEINSGTSTDATKDVLFRECMSDLESKYREDKKMLEENIQETQDDIYELKDKLETLREQREHGKLELSDRYFEITEISKEKILPDKMLMGFEDYDPITIGLEDYTINIIVNPVQSEINTEFVTMCLMQLLCSINPSCINITLVDIKDSSSTYGIFGNLNSIINIVTSSEELEDEIDRLYKIKVHRDSFIRMKADNITEYNQMMINNYGITLPYEILLIANHEESLLNNKKFAQLRGSGNSGIVTMTIWSNRILDYNMKASVQYNSSVADLLYSLQNVKRYSLDGILNLSKDIIMNRVNKIRSAIASANNK